MVAKLSFNLSYSHWPDYVEICDGRYITSDLNIGRIHWPYFGPYLRSSGRYMRTENTSFRRANLAKPTYNANFKAEEFLYSSVECVEGNRNNKNLTSEGSSGIFQGPQDIPAPVANSPTCIWVITVPDKLSFDQFDSNYTSDDYIEIHDGRYSTNALKGKRHEILWRREPKKIRSSGRHLRTYLPNAKFRSLKLWIPRVSFENSKSNMCLHKRTRAKYPFNYVINESSLASLGIFQ